MKDPLLRAKEGDIRKDESLRQVVCIALNLIITYVVLKLEKFGEAKTEVHSQ